MKLQATNVEGVNTVKAKAQQLDGAMGQLETSIRDKDTTLQSQNYQDADDAETNCLFSSSKCSSYNFK